eukprot:m.7649 g.7649  ORF g.7649 m.7649 type:complete len:176 (-) comp5264_c0_seq1:57-584(-)
MSSAMRMLCGAVRSMSTKRKRRPNPNPLMKLVLQEDIPALGQKGAVAEVKRGYGRNFLIPSGKALYLNRETKALVDPEAKSAAEMQNLIPDEVAKLNKIEKQINTKLIEFYRHSTKPFEITPDMVSEACKKQMWLELPPERVEIQKPILRHGLHYVNIHLAPERVATLQIDVMAV